MRRLDRNLGEGMRCIKGDAVEELAKLTRANIALVVLDPPWGVTSCLWDTRIDPLALWGALNVVDRPMQIPLVFGSTSFLSDTIASNRRNFRYGMVWHKNHTVGFLDAKRRPLRAHELIGVFTRHLHASCYRPRMIRGKRHATGHENQRSTTFYGEEPNCPPIRMTSVYYPTDILVFKKDRPHLHPCQKPLALMTWLLETYSRPGDLVLDPFMGSGTTGVACVRTGRKFIGIEKAPKYFKVACRRIAAEQKLATGNRQLATKNP